MRCGFAEDIVEILDELPRGITLIELELCFLSMLYRKNKGNKTWTACEAGISITSMQRRVKEMREFGYYVQPMTEKVTRCKSRYEDNSM